LEHCLDTLVIAFEPSSLEPGRIRIVTTFDERLFFRELNGQEEIFARIFCSFLNKNRGKTIREIGEMEAPFLV
jgi:hypothetical protein